MQTILGAGGAIGIELAKSLKQFTATIRLASRNPKKVNPSDQLMSTDLTNPNDVAKAVAGSKVVYLTVGLPYNTKIWQSTWPLLMTNVIAACKSHQAKLVFFDNIYMYDPESLATLTEAAPIRPVSKKGQVRARIAQMILDEVHNGTLQALIARSADFYGPAIKSNSVLTETVFKNLHGGKKAIWLGSANHRHSFTYVPDAAKATALLGNTPDAYNQIWHLPTAANPFTGKEWIAAIARELGVTPHFQVVPKFMVRLAGLFVPIMKEMVEMLYQYDRDYVFNSSNFETRFGQSPTPYLEGIRAIVATDYKTTIHS